ncbi:acyltransferase [Paraglaciecola sp. L3A3]|uniref:acyltransferase family protein n=1 Tax=Paraglaciecola sp. L3A3 TaxID=2686358 RepID=UPI00131D1A1F|nr:acyltransferase [Paraglaciecola sp. L3A3]
MNSFSFFGILVKFLLDKDIVMNDVKQIAGLTPLRGVAALLVMLMHYQLFIAPLVPVGTTHLFDKLYLMVDLFFVLSGFIMYHVYGGLFATGINKAKFTKFARARFARIYPLHLATLLYLVALAMVCRQFGVTIDGFAGFLFNYEAVPYQLIMLQGIGPFHEALWNTPSWSISTEWWTYMVFPLFMFCLFKFAGWLRLVFVLVIVVAYFWIMFELQPAFWAARWEELGIPDSIPYPVGTIDVITGSAFLRCLCGFVLGLLTYEVYVRDLFKPLFASGWLFALSWLLLLVGWHFDWIYDPIAVSVFAIIILSLSFNSSGLIAFFSHKSFQFLGDISYSLYLVHMPILLSFIVYRKAMYYPDVAESSFGVGYTFSMTHAWLGLFVFLVLTIAISSLSYRYIEQPARKMLK